MAELVASPVGLLVCALLLDVAGMYRLLAGYHPIRLLGIILARGERWLNRPSDPPKRQRFYGCGFVIFCCVLVYAVGFWLQEMAHALVIIIVMAFLFCMRELYARVADVAEALENGKDGIHAVRHLVGRDVAGFDPSASAKAAIESCFENFHDGVVAPLFWYAVGGLPMLLVHKLASTLDSMIGHRSTRYRHFGACAARLDDVLGYIPARLSALVIVLAGMGCYGLREGGVWRWGGVPYFARQHVSVNAGWPEAAAALVLGLRLGGPRRYGEVFVDGAFLGDGRHDAQAEDIRNGLRLYRWSCYLACLLAIGFVAGVA